MSTYHGMSLGGEIRESVSLDEDDLSDVEDEVFIRDGKNGYRLADDIGAKRPLMAPRRKLNKPDISSRLRNRPPLRILCKPCLYGVGGLIVLLGLIVLVAIVVSMFPLPINKIKLWMASKTVEPVIKRLPCMNLKVTDIWSVNLPKLTSETSIRTVDIDNNGVEDIIFGFGTGDNKGILHPNITCPMFFGVSPPCTGGVIALNGSTGEVIWRTYLTSIVFTIFCSADVNDDGVNDCISITAEGTLMVINSVNGSIIWEYENQYNDRDYVQNIYSANFIPDQNHDNVSDILVAHTMSREIQIPEQGHIMLICGKTGKDIQKLETPNNTQTFYTPQILPQKNGNNLILFGTGRPDTGGQLHVIPIKEFISGNTTSRIIYQDPVKGILTPSILVDITGDGQVDIITALFNSTVVAIDGDTFKEIWNFTVPKSETLSVLTPGYFNDDNVTDFLIKYQTGREYPIYFYSQTFIIDGKTGNPIYKEPLIDSVGSEMGGLTLPMESQGFDYFLFWMEDCVGYEGRKDMFTFLDGNSAQDENKVDMCKLRFNSSRVTKLYALNQYLQPPGILLYNSENQTSIEFKNVKTPFEEANEYLIDHPEFKMLNSHITDEVMPEKNFNDANNPDLFKTVKYSNEGSPFRHKGNNQGLVKNFSKQDKITNGYNNDEQQTKYDEPLPDYDDYPTRELANYVNNLDAHDPVNYDDAVYVHAANNINPITKPYRQQAAVAAAQQEPQHSVVNGNSGRDPRSRERQEEEIESMLPVEGDGGGGVYGKRNVKNAKVRLSHDLASSPDEILQDTYFKSRERELRRSLRRERRFRQRDVHTASDHPPHNTVDGDLVSEDVVQETVARERAAVNERNESAASLNLWNLESEREREDKDSRMKRRRRRRESARRTSVYGIPRVTSVGTLVKSINTSDNSMDLIFLTYWTPPKDGPQILIQSDLDCINRKISKALNSKENFLNYEKERLQELFRKQCLEERGVKVNEHPVFTETNQKEDIRTNFPYFNQISQLSYGQMTVYRVRITCHCDKLNPGELCNRFSNPNSNNWNSYLDSKGDGIYVRV